MRIKIDHSLCTGCKQCEFACALAHAGKANPWRSRIRVFIEEDFCLPVIAGPYTEASCNAKGIVVIDGVDVNECVTCRASCPVKAVYKEPDTGIPLKCDFCGDPPDPQCVLWCAPGALELVDD